MKIGKEVAERIVPMKPDFPGVVRDGRSNAQQHQRQNRETITLVQPGLAWRRRRSEVHARITWLTGALVDGKRTVQ
jgi:hypothetical protein